MENQGRAFGWDDQIEKDSEFIVLPDGEYDFVVESFERARHGGSEKLPACPKAVVNLKIKSTQGDVTIRHNLFLHTITEGMLSAFFSGIGLKKKGEPLRMDWSKVTGATGRAKIRTKTYNDNQYNEVKSFIPKEPSASPYTQGTF